MIGSRLGSALGALLGAAVGSGADDEKSGGTGIPGVTRDASSGIYTPSNSSEWTTFLTAVGLLGLGVPNSLWLAQEASGNLADSIGALTLTAAGTPTYQNTVSGWARKAAGTPVASASRFAMASGTGPNPTTTSSLWFWLGNMTPIAAARNWGGVAAGATAYQAVTDATNHVGNTVAGVTTVGASSIVGVTGPLVFNYDRTGSRANVYTSQEKVVGTYNAGVLDGFKGWGANGGTGILSNMLYGFMYSGAPGEMSDANIKALLVAMGFTIPWT